MRAETGSAGVDVLVARTIDSVPSAADICPTLGGAIACLVLHHVEWRETIVRADERQIVYRFRARDAESVRQALRLTGMDYDELRVDAAAG